MALWSMRLRRFVPPLGLAMLIVGLGLAGCDKQPASPRDVEPAKEKAADADDGKDNNADPLQQPFAKATRRGDDPPADRPHPRMPGIADRDCLCACHVRDHAHST